MAVTFAVDEVTPAAAPAATVPLADLVGPHVALGAPADLRVLPERRIHPLLAAVQRAFDDHRPLVLSPDAVWLTITGGLAHHLRLHAERLRPRLVRHQGRKQLRIELPWAPVDADDWADAIDGWCRGVADEPGAGAALAKLCACDFSTSGPAERVAAQVVLMDAMTPYYTYVAGLVCGIPAITVTGTPDDWRAVRARIDVLAELELDWWTRSLAPVVDRLIDAAEGRPDVAHFRAIYKPARAYGSDRIAGWVARLYPYVRGDGGAHATRNPLLAFGLDEPLPGGHDAHGYYQGPAIASEDAPWAPSRAVVVVLHQASGTSTAFQLEGGLLAVEQDEEGRLVPRAGWLVRPEGTGADAVIEQILVAHQGVPAETPPDDWPEGCGALFAAFREVFLFEGPGRWHVRGADGWDELLLARGRDGLVGARRVVDLPDGTLLAVVSGDPPVVVRLRADLLGPIETIRDPSDHPVDIFPDTPARPPRTLRVRRTREPWASLPVVGDGLLAVLGEAMRRGGALPVSDGRTLIDVVPAAWDGWSHAEPLLARLRAGGHLGELASADDGARWELGEALAGVTVPIGPYRCRFLRHVDRRHLRLAAIDRVAWERVDLGDGTALAQVDLGDDARFIHVRGDALREEVVPRRRGRGELRVTVNAQPRDELRVVGRSLVEILTHVLEHGTLAPGRPWPAAR